MKKEEKEKMNLKEFTTRIKLLTKKQQLMIKPQIYYNPDHIHYYDQFNKGNYEFCIDYLNENIELLNANKITNESMTRQERRENMKEINEALKKLKEKPVKLNQEQQDYIITNSKVLFGFQIKASSLYDQNDFTTLPAFLAEKVNKDIDEIKDALQIDVHIDEDEDTVVYSKEEDEQILDAINIYCLLINGYNFSGWTNINVVKSLYNNAYDLIISEEGYVKFKKEQLDKMFDKINKDIERELKHKTWDEEKEECESGAGLGDYGLEYLEEGEDYYWIMNYEAKHIHFDPEELEEWEESGAGYGASYLEELDRIKKCRLGLTDEEYHEFLMREEYRESCGNEDDEDIIKPSITDIPESVEEMLKNVDK